MISPAYQIKKSWWDSNKIKTNPTKSGILKIAYKKSKLRHIDNPLNIKEVDSYNYLGMTFDQGLRFNRIPPIIKQTEGLIRTKLKRINFKEIDMVSRKTNFHSLCCQRLTYGLECLFDMSKSYNKFIKSWIYRIAKRWFGIRSNPSQIEVLQILGINLELIEGQKLISIRRKAAGVAHFTPLKEKISIHNKTSLELINLVLKQMHIVFKYESRCKWSEILTFSHSFNNCELHGDWRIDLSHLLKIRIDGCIHSNYVKIFKSGNESKIVILNKLAERFYSIFGHLKKQDET